MMFKTCVVGLVEMVMDYFERSRSTIYALLIDGLRYGKTTLTQVRKSNEHEIGLVNLIQKLIVLLEQKE